MKRKQIAGNTGDEGAKKLGEALMINTTLTELNLHGDDTMLR